MKILRVLNTNSVVTIDEKKREVIITGPGIGFKKKKGECIDDTLIDKIYCLEDQDKNHTLQEIVKAISERYLEIVRKVVQAAKTEYHLKINEVLYITLTDHINSVIERHAEGIHLKNMIKMDIQKFYPKEYELGERTVKWIQEETGISLENDEAAFIAMHIVSSEMESSDTPVVRKIVELINAIMQIIRIHFKIEFDETSVSYQRFLAHLKFFSARIFSGKTYKDSMHEIYDVMVEQNAYAYKGVEKVSTLIKKQYDYTLSIDEQLYLLIHIKRILDEQ